MTAGLPSAPCYHGMNRELGIFGGPLYFFRHSGVFHRLALYPLESYVAGKLEAVGVAHISHWMFMELASSLRYHTSVKLRMN